MSKPSKNPLHTVETKVLKVLRAAGRKGLTTDQIEQKTGLLHQTASPSVIRLRRLGYVRENGVRRPTRTGRKANVQVAYEYL